VFAGAVAATSGQPVQRVWGIWAAGGYALAALACVLWRSRGREAALAAALTGALAGPLAWQVTFGATMSRVGEGSLSVVARSAVLLLRHGTPYLPADQIARFFDYNPYEPAMAIFGLPAAAGLHGAAGNPRLWMGVVTAAVLAAGFRLATPGSTLRRTAFALGSPVLALPLTTGLTDPPVLALLSLAFACVAAGPRRPRVQMAAAIALGAACAMKATAWPALPIIAAVLAARDGGRAATRFVVTAGITTSALFAAMAPASATAPAAFFENTVLFPLGLTRHQTPADSPLPGHILAASGPAGRWAALGLLGAAALAMGASLVVRPPAGTRAAASRLALGLAVLFTLAPASRWGYFVYPVALLGFVHVIRSERGPWATAERVQAGEGRLCWRASCAAGLAHPGGHQLVGVRDDWMRAGRPTTHGKRAHARRGGDDRDQARLRVGGDPPGDVGRQHDRVARTHRRGVRARLDAGPAVQHGPDLLGVNAMQRPGLTRPHLDSPHHLRGLALRGRGQRGHDRVLGLGATRFRAPDDSHIF
jgi:hypothetical protein